MNPPQHYSPVTFQAPVQVLPIAANTILPAGNLVARDQNGNAVLAADLAGLVMAGVACGRPPYPGNDRETMDTSDCPAGRYNVLCKTGFYRFPNSSAAPVTITELGQPVFVEDERTVAKTTTHGVVAGIAVGLDGTTAVWLFIGAVGTLPGSPTLGDAPPASPDNESTSSPTAGSV